MPFNTHLITESVFQQECDNNGKGIGTTVASTPNNLIIYKWWIDRLLNCIFTLVYLHLLYKNIYIGIDCIRINIITGLKQIDSTLKRPVTRKSKTILNFYMIVLKVYN